MLIALCLSFLFSCTNEKGQLNGHWHILQVGIENNDFGEYSTIDIQNDTIAIFNKDLFSGYGFYGRVNYEDKTMLIGGECFVLDFRYRLLGDKLLLNQAHYDAEDDISFIGEKCDSSCCDLQQEFFRNTLIKVDFPTINGQEQQLKSIAGMKKSLLRAVYIGKNRYPITALYQEDYIVSLGGQRIGYEEIELWREKHYIKIPENKRALARSVVFADNSTPKSKLLDVIEKIQETEENPIYLALKNSQGKFDIKFVTLYHDNYISDIDLYFGN